MKRTELYRHYDQNNRLLYVGVSLSTFTRLASHRCCSDWFEQITMIQIERFDTRAQALIAERNAIVTEKPKFNKIHTDLVKDNSAKKILNCKDVSGLTNISVQKLRATVRNGCCPVAPIPGMKPPKWRASDVDAFCARDAG